MGPRRTAAILALGAGLTLAACGTATGAHAARPARPAAADGAAPSLTAQTLDQVDTDIGSVHNALNQADTDLDNPKPDS
jgi:hypothetical protein